MFGETWSDKSVNLVTNIKCRTESLIEKLGLNFKVNHTMSGFNDRLVITDDSNKDDYLFISFIIGWFNADAEIAVVHKHNNGSESERVTNKYLEFDNSAFENHVDKERYEGYLCENKIKYYPSPFDERENDIFEDIKAILLKQIN